MEFLKCAHSLTYAFMCIISNPQNAPVIDIILILKLREAQYLKKVTQLVSN